MRLSPENLWRFALLGAFMFWQGGFLFYSTIVISVSHDVLGSHRETGFITQRVSNWLNLSAGIVLAALLINGVLAHRKKAPLVSGLWITWLIMAAALAALIWLHPILDAHLIEEARAIREKADFRHLHHIYLSITTIQWAAAMAHLWCLIAAPRSAG